MSGRPAGEITLDAIRSGEIGPEDIRISPDTLISQAAVARSHGNPQLAANLLRAAELARLADSRVLTIYEALRPRRSTAAELEGIAEALEAEGAPLCAQLVRDASRAYGRRGLLA